MMLRLRVRSKIMPETSEIESRRSAVTIAPASASPSLSRRAGTNR